MNFDLLRIEKQNQRIQALLPEVGRLERLQRQLQQLQQLFPEASHRPPLFGWMVGVKDIFHVDELPTHCGSQLPGGTFVGAEADVVGLLRSNGAVILGKTVTTPFAMRDPSPTRNPHALDHTPGGSSSGSAAAVAAGFCRLAIGSQTIGSTIRPAAYCGVVGFKPSFGRISTVGMVPDAPSLDHVGLFTQDIADMAIVAPLLCKQWHDTLPPTTLKLGIPTGAYLHQVDDEMRRHFDTLLRHLRRQGIELVELQLFTDLENINSFNTTLFNGEIALTHVRWFEKYHDLYPENATATILAGQQVTIEQILAAKAQQLELRQAISIAMRQQMISAWLMPATLGVAPLGIQTGSPAMQAPWNFAGLPMLNVPAGKNRQGLPFGVQLVGDWQCDEQLLAIALHQLHID